MEVLIDSREKERAITGIVRYFDANGIKHASQALYVGDYWSPDNPRVFVDRKQTLTEVCGNLCQQHERFRRECLRAQGLGMKLIILVEHGRGIKSLGDVETWENPRLKTSPKATTGEQIAKIMRTMDERYDVEWRFCEKKDTGAEIVRILEQEHA